LFAATAAAAASRTSIFNAYYGSKYICYKK